MPSPERPPIPDWAKKERTSDLAWIVENWHVFWPAAQQGYKDSGRGGIVVDIIARPTGAGHPFVYLPQAGIEKLEDPDALRMVKQYDPTWEIVTMLLKSKGRTSTYRVGMAKHEDKQP